MDVIIILGAKIGRDGYPSRVGRFRLQHALPLVIETYPHSRVIISGGVLPGRTVSEARAMGDWLVGKAMEHWGEIESRKLEHRLLPDEISLNTADTAFYAAVLMQERNFKTAGVITDTLHMPRVEYLFNRTFGPRQLQFRPLPAPGLLQDYWQRRRYLRLSKFLLREAGAWVKAWGRGITGIT